MKNLKEKQLLVNLAKTLGQKADEEIVKELREFDRIKTEARKSVSKDPMSYILEAARKLNEEPKMDTPEYPLPPSLDELREMLKDIPELKPEDRIEVLEGEEEWASKAIDESEETLIEKSVKIISEAPKDSFQQPDPPAVPADIQAITGKLKQLEQWVGKISMAGPGSGEVKLRFLDDVARETIADGRWLKYDGSRKKFVFDEINPYEVVYNTTEVTTSTYTVEDNDYYIGVNYAGPATITLPSTANSGRVLVIKDEDGDAETNPITVQGTVDNDAGGFIIQINNGAIQLIYRNGWRIV